MLKRLWLIYYDGIREMPHWARVVCFIVIAKLLIMFLVFKLCFMPDYLGSRYTTDREKSEHVLQELITKP